LFYKNGRDFLEDLESEYRGLRCGKSRIKDKIIYPDQEPPPEEVAFALVKKTGQHNND